MILMNLIAVLAYVILLVYIMRTYRKYSLFFAYVSAYHLWALISCFYNDLGIYNFELFAYTDTSLATTRLALFYIVFNLGFLLAAKLIGKHLLARREYGMVGRMPDLGSIKLLLIAGLAAIVAYEGYSLVTNGIPLLTGVDREEFSQSAGLVNRLVLTWGVGGVFFLGMTRRGSKLFCLQNLAVGLMLLYAVLTGHKFSFPSMILCAYYLPIGIRRLHADPDWNPFRFGNLARLFTICVLFGGLVYGTYSSELEDNDLAQALIVQRVLALQGEVWWAIDNEVSSSGGYDKNHWEEELAYIISPNQGSANDVGMRYLMIKMLGREKAYTILDSGYLYTMAYPAILIMTFSSLVALIIQFLAGVIFFVLVYYLFWCVTYNHYARAIVALLIALPFTTVLATGNFFVFFTFGMVVKISVLICLESLPLGVFRQPSPALSGVN